MRYNISQERQDTIESWFGENKKNDVSSFYMERLNGPDGTTCTIASGTEGEVIDGLIGWLINRVMQGHLCLEELNAKITVRYYDAKHRQEEANEEETKEEDNT